MYEDLLELLVPGFLAHSVVINDVPVSLRSLYPSDIYMLQHRIGPNAPEKEWTCWFVASSVWMVGGLPVLEDSRAPYEVYQMLKNLPDIALADLSYLVTNLVKRANEATDVFESFSYEHESRYLWRAYGTRLHEVSGVPGVNRYGYNTVQRLWFAYNNSEDIREEYHREWNHAKLIAAAHAPKGIQKINRSDEQAIEEEDRRRERVQLSAFSRWRGIDVEMPKDALLKGGDPARFASISHSVSAEELEDEMQKVRMGIKDEHDRIVEYYKMKVREKIEMERQEQQDRIRKTQQAMENAGIKESLQPLMMSAEDIAKKMGGRRGIQIYENPKATSLYEKYIKQDAVVGHVETRGAQAVAVPDQNLMDRISQRQVTVESEEE